MALSASPRKIVPLSSGDDSKRPGPAAAPALTKSVFFCGVVVEGSEHGRKLPQGTSMNSMAMICHDILADVEDLVRSLGTPVSAQEGQDTLRSNVSPSPNKPAESVSLSTISNTLLAVEILAGVRMTPRVELSYAFANISTGPPLAEKTRND